MTTWANAQTAADGAGTSGSGVGNGAANSGVNNKNNRSGNNLQKTLDPGLNKPPLNNPNPNVLHPDNNINQNTVEPNFPNNNLNFNGGLNTNSPSMITNMNGVNPNHRNYYTHGINNPNYPASQYPQGQTNGYGWNTNGHWNTNGYPRMGNPTNHLPAYPPIGR